MLAASPGGARMREALLAHGARIGVVEALMLPTTSGSRRCSPAPAAALPARVANAGSLLMFARTPFAIERLVALGVPADLRDRWGTSPIDPHARDEEHDATPRCWAATSVEITRNPLAGPVAAWLAAIADDQGEPA